MVGKPVILVALAATLSAAGAFADDPPASPEKERRICRGAARALGSHIRAPRRCRTAEQWREEDEAKARRPNSLLITEGQNDGRSGPTPQ